MDTILTKAQCLKKLKELGIYEKPHFSMKVVDLKKIIQDKLENPSPPKKITIEEPVFEEEEEKEDEKEDENLTKHQKTKIKKDKIVKKLLAKPLFEYNKKVIIEPDNYTGKPPSKHQLKVMYAKKIEEEKEQAIQSQEIVPPKVKVNKLQKIQKPKIDYKKAIQSVIKKLNDDILELLHDFDTERLTLSDKDLINTEYQKILDCAYIDLEKELEEIEDENYIKLIERKIKIMDDRVQLFLED